MMQIYELTTDHIVRALRIFQKDLTDPHSPFNKDKAYLENLAAWLATAATRLEGPPAFISSAGTGNNTTPKDEGGGR